MTEHSLPWPGTSLGDAGPYDDLVWPILNNILAACAGGEGIAPRFWNGLAITVTGANTLSVNTGGAVLDGKVYYNDAAKSINVPSAVGVGNTRIDRIVLRCNWSSAQARLYRIPGLDAVSPLVPAVYNIHQSLYDILLSQVLVDTSGNLTLTNEHILSVQKSFGCRIYNGSGQTLTTGTPTVLAMPDEAWDDDNLHSTSVNNSRITIVQAGRYMIVGEIIWDIDNAGWRRIAVRKNGSTISAQTLLPITVEYTDQNISCISACNQGDYIELEGWHTKGSNLATVQQILTLAFMGV